MTPSVVGTAAGQIPAGARPAETDQGGTLGAASGGSAPVLPRFLADAMLGRLARWLRLLGYDTEYCAGAADAEIAGRARAEGRVILTRDLGLIKRRGVQAVLIGSDRVSEQIAQVTSAFPAPRLNDSVRCSLCNELLAALPSAEARLRVPPHVARCHDSFWQCSRCGRIYWQGTHWRAINGFLTGPTAGSS